MCECNVPSLHVTEHTAKLRNEELEENLRMTRDHLGKALDAKHETAQKLQHLVKQNEQENLQKKKPSIGTEAQKRLKGISGNSNSNKKEKEKKKEKVKEEEKEKKGLFDSSSTTGLLEKEEKERKGLFDSSSSTGLFDSSSSNEDKGNKEKKLNDVAESSTKTDTISVVDDIIGKY